MIRLPRLLSPLCLLLITACVGVGPGPRQVKVGPLLPHEGTKVAVEQPAGEVERAAAEGLRRGAAQGSGLAAGEPGEEAFRLRLARFDMVQPAAPAAPTPEGHLGAREVAEKARASLTGGGLTRRGGISLRAELLAPGGTEPVGFVEFEQEGPPANIAESAGFAAGKALGEEMKLRRDDWFERRAFDERMFLTPTPNTAQKGEVFLTSDELLLFRAGVGLGRRVQLHGWFGGAGLPYAGAAPLPIIELLGGAGGGAIGLVGVADLGIKVRVLDESRYLPGVALSYDLLDVFGAAFGLGAGVMVGRGGYLLGGMGGAAGANVQLNVLSAAVGKHFGSTHVVAGTWFVDNHHFLPQTAGIAVGGSVTANDGDGFSDPQDYDWERAQKIDRLPSVWIPFLSAEHVLGPRSALVAELFPRPELRDWMGTTGVRWNLGYSKPKGPWAADRTRFRVDLAGVWMYLPSTKSPDEGLVIPLPWLGLGVDLQ